MIKIIHRVNTISRLKTISVDCGIEIDIRANGKDLILNHEPFENGDSLEEYLKLYNHKLIILNIKEAGIEDKVIELVKKYNIKDYFLLDVEFPYIYRSTREGNRNIAIRYSEDEVIEQALLYKDNVDYIFIDTNTKLPIDKDFIEKTKGFKSCLVSPDRWGRQEDIVTYKKMMEDLGYKLDYVMVAEQYANLWD
ncbi:hypothetical protein EOM39_00130 [Candidatus Gracilibacteria bacterium]|nr:hypothetical protein [Candidatus Gracilibacteria bacterium]